MALEQVVKLCECGCGQPAPLARQNDTKRGYVRGKPCRFIFGHPNKNKVISGYRQVQAPRIGNIALHRWRAEQAIGHPLPAGAKVHHHNEDPWNATAQLVICPDEAYHKLLHFRMRVRRAGGNPNTDKICATCQRVKPYSAFAKHPHQPLGLQRACRECRRNYRLRTGK